MIAFLSYCSISTRVGRAPWLSAEYGIDVRSCGTLCCIWAACYHDKIGILFAYLHRSYSSVTSLELKNGVVCKTVNVCTINLTTFAAEKTVSLANMTSAILDTHTGAPSMMCWKINLETGMLFAVERRH